MALGAEVLTTPYTISWNTVDPAMAAIPRPPKREMPSATKPPAGVVVNVNNDAGRLPTVTMTAPAAGNVSGTISVTATATDLVGVVVQFLWMG